MCESSDAPAADAAEELERAFLRFHGSLFTRIGMETAEALTADCVCALRLCLEATPDDTAALSVPRTLQVYRAHVARWDALTNVFHARRGHRKLPQRVRSGQTADDGALSRCLNPRVLPTHLRDLLALCLLTILSCLAQRGIPAETVCCG